MRHLSRQIAILLTLLCVGTGSRLAAQTYGAAGTFSGVGLTLMPDATVAPKAQMRLDLSRLQYLRSSGKGSNNVVLGAGMSSNLEVYMRIIGEQVGTVSSATSVGYGGKLLLPFRMPVVREAALWFEAASSETDDPSAMVSMPMTRVGLVGTSGPNGSHAVLLAGAAFNDESATVMAGAGWVHPLSHGVVVSPEAIYGYFGRDSYALLLNGTLRLFPNVSLQISPGYCRSRGLASGLLTLGISISTATIDFDSRTVEKQIREGFTLPTIEEMESEGTKKNTPKDDKPKEPTGGTHPNEPHGQTSTEVIQQGDLHR